MGCYALFQYLTMGIQAANGVYNQARETMEELHHTLMHNKQNNSNGEASTVSFTANQSAVDSRQDVTRLACECEAIAVQQAALHRYHNSVDVFPLATLRQTLTSAITTWPGCAPLWSIYVQVSQGPFLREVHLFDCEFELDAVIVTELLHSVAKCVLLIL